MTGMLVMARVAFVSVMVVRYCRSVSGMMIGHRRHVRSGPKEGLHPRDLGLLRLDDRVGER